MNAYRGPTFGASSKATASTLCHYSFECKAGAQERPYVPRPSRTQQLLNPKLAPKLSSDVPQETLKRKGIADQQLAQREHERNQKREREEEDGDKIRSKRSRSVSSVTSASVSTISTNASRSPTQDRMRGVESDRVANSPHRSTSERKKRRRGSYSSTESERDDGDFDSHDSVGNRNTRRKIRETSPYERGRRRSRSTSGAQSLQSTDETPIYESRDHESRHMSSEAPSRSNRARYDNSSYRRDRQYRQAEPRKHYDENEETMSSIGNLGTRKAPKERSLSPFSKRLALTQAMNMGR